LPSSFFNASNQNKLCQEQPQPIFISGSFVETILHYIIVSLNRNAVGEFTRFEPSTLFSF